MSATALPEGDNVPEMIRRLRAIDAEFFGTLFATAGELGDLTVTGTLTMDKDGTIRTASSGQRIEIRNTNRNRIGFYSGDIAELQPGWITESTIGSGGTRTLQFGTYSPLVSANDWNAAFVVRSASVDSTNVPAFIFAASINGDGSGALPEVQIQQNIKLVTSGDIAMSEGVLTLGALGSASAPAVGIGSFFDDGIYSPQDGQLGFATNGVYAGHITANGDWLFGDGSTGRAQISDIGSATWPTYTFQGDPNTGMYRAGTDVLAFTTNGTVAAVINNTQDWQFGQQSTGNAKIHGGGAGRTDFVTYSFQGDANTGMYRAGADQLSFSRANKLRYNIVTTHSFYRADGTLGYRVGATGASYITRTYQSNGSTVALEVLPTNLKYLAQYSSTTASSANLYITSASNFRRSTASSRRYKNRIKDLKVEGTLRPRSFHYNKGYVTDDPEGKDEKWYFIAEEVEEEFGSSAVEYTEEGKLEDVNVKAIVAIMAQKINRLEKLVMELSK